MSLGSVNGRHAIAGCVLAVVGAWSGWARADAADTNTAAPFGQPASGDRVYVHGLFDELEGRFGGGSDASFRWDGEAWVGTDSNRLWFKSEGFAAHGRVDDGDHELLYARAISSYFDLQTGVRYDLDSAAGRGWAAVGVEGLAPYFFRLSATLYASDAAHFAAKVVVSYEALLTQRLIVEPLVELNAYTRSDPRRDVASGLSDLDAGLRLRYEISRKFAPYLGVVYERTYGPALAGIAADSSRGPDWRLTVGVRTWF